MDRLRNVEVFVAVASTGSFAAAARKFGVSRASVTKQVAALERSLGARLLHRTTRRVGLTAAGRAALENGQLLLQRYEQIEADVRESARSPRGVVRVGTPPAFGTQHLVPLAAAFAERHPDIQVALLIDMGSTDLVAEGLDLAVRIAPTLADSGHVGQPIAKAPQVLVASPAYLARRGTPRGVEDLAQHNCLVHSIKSPTGLWRFHTPDGPIALRVRGTIHSNFGEALKHAAVLGHGISMHPYYMVSEDLAAGRLVSVLPEHPPQAYEIHVIYSSRHLPVRVRRFLDFLRDWAKTPPEWSIPAIAAIAGRPAAKRRPRAAASRRASLDGEQ